MSGETGFRQNGGPWHLGFSYGRCGEPNDMRVSVSDIREQSARPLTEWCEGCYVARNKRRIEELREDIAESQAELDAYLSECEARQAEWRAANAPTTPPASTSSEPKP